jgi:cytosine deaminase
LTRIANLYANVVQRYGPQDLGVCFEMITDRAAKLMRLANYGIGVGKAADLVVWGENRPCDVIARSALPLAGFKRGRRIFSRELPELQRPA